MSQALRMRGTQKKKARAAKRHKRAPAAISHQQRKTGLGRRTRSKTFSNEGTGHEWVDTEHKQE